MSRFIEVTEKYGAKRLLSVFDISGVKQVEDDDGPMTLVYFREGPSMRVIEPFEIVAGRVHFASSECQCR